MHHAPVHVLPPMQWVKARRSAVGNCVELAAHPDGQHVAVRHSKEPDGVALVYTKAEVEAFLDGAKRGEFDHLVA